MNYRKPEDEITIQLSYESQNAIAMTTRIPRLCDPTKLYTCVSTVEYHIEADFDFVVCPIIK